MNYWSTIIAAVIFIVLMVFNLGWLFSVNYNLKISVEKEREASAAKTDFLSRMSHDIRTPLNVIIGMTGLAEKEEGNPEETKKYLSDISQSGKFLLSLVNDILDLNKVESGKMEMHLEPYSLKEFKSSINAIIEPLCEDKKINFIITIDEDERKFLLDKVRINQIFFNILSNSVKFTSENGHISLKVSEHLMPSGTEANLVFIASDDGSGMSKEFQTHMFDAFSQEHKEGQPNVQGTGLGLTIVKNFVDLMDGSIAVDSKPGKGTTFTIIIPATVAKDIKGMEEEKKEAVAKLSGRRILLVEDNALNAEIAKKLLEEKGCIVECASDGKAGVEKFESSAINYYDAILMDLRMPVMGGIEATKVVRSLNKDDALTIPIIAMTANAYDIDVKNCLDSGMNAHIPKPIDPDLMYQTIAKEIAKRK